MNIYQKKLYNQAFTLIELLTVVGIIVLIVTGILVGTGKPKQTSALERATQEIMLTLRNAQYHALVINTGTNDIAPCGFGIHYSNEESIIFFREETPSQGTECIATSTPAQNIDRLYQGYGLDIVLDTINLTESNKVKFANNFPDIYFEPPDGLTYINGSRNVSSTDIILCLRNNCSMYQKTIRVYLGGNIEVVD